MDTCNEEEDDDTGTAGGETTRKRKKRKRKKQEDENNKEEEKEQYAKINESLIASTIKMEEATKATLLVSINSRIDAAQSKLDEFDEALDELDDDDTSSKKYLRLTRRRKETALKLQKLENETEQYV